MNVSFNVQLQVLSNNIANLFIKHDILMLLW